MTVAKATLRPPGQMVGEQPKPMSTRPDPTPRKDGCCVVCGGRIPATASKYAPSDGFCKRQCAQEYHGTSLTVDVEIPEHVGARSYTHSISQKPRQF